MTLKDFYKREKQVALNAQPRKFRIAKWIVILIVATAVYEWKGVLTVFLLFLALAIIGTILHFFFRYKTEAWTKSWGPYKRIPLDSD